MRYGSVIWTGAVRNLQNRPACTHDWSESDSLLKRKKTDFHAGIYVIADTRNRCCAVFSVLNDLRDRSFPYFHKLHFYKNPFGRRRRVARFPPAPPRDKPRRHKFFRDHFVIAILFFFTVVEKTIGFFLHNHRI